MTLERPSHKRRCIYTRLPCFFFQVLLIVSLNVGYICIFLDVESSVFPMKSFVPVNTIAFEFCHFTLILKNLKSKKTVETICKHLRTEVHSGNLGNVN